MNNYYTIRKEMIVTCFLCKQEISFFMFLEKRRDFFDDLQALLQTTLKS